MDSIGSLPDVQGLCCRESKYRVPFSVQHSNTKESRGSLTDLRGGDAWGS
jgi:hypothetical protein